MIGLVGCVKSKLDHAAPARDLYTSPLFEGRVCYVERQCDRWFVISALHHLVRADARVDPYEYTLKGQSVAIKRAWASRVLEQLELEVGPVRGLRFSVHAGADYLGFGLTKGLVAQGATVDNPVEGLSMGKQLQFYQRECQR